jgi:hypothetical protein
LVQNQGCDLMESGRVMETIHWLDVIVVAVWLFYVWYGWGRGLFEGIAEVVTGMIIWGSLIAFWQPFEFYLVRNLGLTKDWAPFAAAILLISAFGLSTFSLLRSVALRLPRQHYTVIWHILWGTFPSIIAGGLLVMLLLMMLTTLSFSDLTSIQADTSWFYNLAVRLAGFIH